MRQSIALALLLAALPSWQAASAAPPAYDHYDPVLLNEHAVQAARDGDGETALILLERAARIFPGDPRIAANLEALRAGKGGRAPAGATLRPAPAAQPAPPPLLFPEPPQLWPQP